MLLSGRVSIRTLVSASFLGARSRLGSVGESMLPVLGRPRSGPKSARSHRNTGSSQQVNMMFSQAASA